MSENVLIDLESFRVTGRSRPGSPAALEDTPPLIIALHGGGFTSAYFDCPPYSLLATASDAGCPSIAIDRPGYGGSTKLVPGERAIQRNADHLQDVIAEIWQSRTTEASGVVLVGHSIGSAVALYLAAQAPDWPLLGVAFSGLLISPPVNTPPFWTFREPDEWVHNPAEDRKVRMFGPPDTYVPGAPELCDSVSRPVWWREIVETYTLWHDEYTAVCSEIRVPVHYRHGELDFLWANDLEEFDRFRAAFTNAPSVDAAIVPQTGHCIDFHLTGMSLHNEQVAFARACARRSVGIDA